MRADGFPRPGPYWVAHAIIAGGHAESWALRVILAECEIGIDDPYNGCWLPARTKYTGQQPYPKALPHSRIHRFNYYAWLNIRFAGLRGRTDIMISKLLRTRTDLLYGSYPPEVMLKKGEWEKPYDNISST